MGIIDMFALVWITFLPAFFALDPDGKFPSCLKKGISWDQSNVFDLIVNIHSPEECQVQCGSREGCKGFTWIEEESDFYPLSCGLFSEQSEEMECPHCISGDPKCPCLLEGECVSHDGNVIQAIPEVPTVDECEEICKTEDNCTFFSYFGESNSLSHLCLLYSMCDEVDEACEDCVIGVPDCQVCSFEDTYNGKCIGCDEGWSEFEGFCYKLIDNGGAHYYGKEECEKDCSKAGGQLTSIHSSQENEFVYSLLRPAKSKVYGQATYLGTEFDENGNLVWSDGTPWNYDHWFGHDPDSGTECVIIGYISSDPEKWIDCGCSYSHQDLDCMCKKKVYH